MPLLITHMADFETDAKMIVRLGDRIDKQSPNLLQRWLWKTQKNVQLSEEFCYVYWDASSPAGTKKAFESALKRAARKGCDSVAVSCEDEISLDFAKQAAKSFLQKHDLLILLCVPSDTTFSGLSISRLEEIFFEEEADESQYKTPTSTYVASFLKDIVREAQMNAPKDLDANTSRQLQVMAYFFERHDLSDLTDWGLEELANHLHIFRDRSLLSKQRMQEAEDLLQTLIRMENEADRDEGIGLWDEDQSADYCVESGRETERIGCLEADFQPAPPMAAPADTCEQKIQSRRYMDAEMRPCPAPQAARPQAKKSTSRGSFSELQKFLKQNDAGFRDTLLKYIDRTGQKDSVIYKKANIDRRLYSKILNIQGYNPSKPTAIAFAIALELNLEETKDLIGRAGYALSTANTFDRIVEFFILEGNYDIYEINEALFHFDQSLLGC